MLVSEMLNKNYVVNNHLNNTAGFCRY